MREYIFPLVLTLILMVLGVMIALAPVLDPGFVHPIALASFGIMGAMTGAAGMAGVTAMFVGDRARARA